MNREHRQELLRSYRLVKTEDLTEMKMYRIQHMSTNDDDDDDDDAAVILYLETKEGSYIYTSPPACNFELDDISRISNGELKSMKICRLISEPRFSGIIYVCLYIDNAGILVAIPIYIQT